mmetsp:Transcript_19149/g.40343  ORF Transcript_19149/g.40343 Transcript_19149/m.40343 type:complete len:106 (+) Transcript_19149:950-1267(+)
MNGPSSSTCVSGMVQTAGAFLSNGLGMVSDFAVVEDHVPATMLDTACGSGSDPREDGSTVAQLGSAERARRPRWDRVPRRTWEEMALAPRRDLESIMSWRLVYLL